MSNKLTIELVPSTSFYHNLRSMLSKEEWDILRRDSYKKANYKCEVCGERGLNHPVECHEAWEYDDRKHIQKLVKLISLCPKCHQVKHIGLSQIRGLENDCINHLIKVNKIKKEKVVKLISNAFKVWDERSKYEWEIDISILAHKEGE